MLALGLILAAGAIGLSKTKDLQKTIEAVGCTVAITLDDIINGNATESGRFFIGLRTLANKMDDIKNSLTTINTQLNNINPTGTDVTASVTAYTNAKGAIAIVPANANATLATPFSYETPFDASGATAPTLASNLPADLGSNAAANAGTPIFNAYNGLDAVQAIISGMAAGAASLQTAIAGSFATGLDAAKGPLKDVATTL